MYTPSEDEDEAPPTPQLAKPFTYDKGTEPAPAPPAPRPERKKPYVPKPRRNPMAARVSRPGGPLWF